jgi:hypothetical protein
MGMIPSCNNPKNKFNFSLSDLVVDSGTVQEVKSGALHLIINKL